MLRKTEAIPMRLNNSLRIGVFVAVILGLSGFSLFGKPNYCPEIVDWTKVSNGTAGAAEMQAYKIFKGESEYMCRTEFRYTQSGKAKLVKKCIEEKYKECGAPSELAKKHTDASNNR
ncbi:MAG: hypothetical protein NZ744_06800 [Pirellulaceae bacterium]|nr:hypothetical protein [Pirellulaceae bacterium]